MTNAMNTDELLAQYLEGTLTAEAKADFERTVEQSPELAQELRELRTLENLLHRPAEQQYALASAASPFLQAVENNLAAVVVGAGAAVGVGAAAALASKSGATGVGAWISSLFSTFSTVASSTAGIIATGSAVVIGGATAYYVATKPAPTAESTSSNRQGQITKHVLPERGNAGRTTAEFSASQPTDQTLEQQALNQPADSAAMQTQQMGTVQATSSLTLKPSEQEAVPNASSPRLPEYDARINASGGINAKYAALIEDYTKQFQVKEAQGDKAATALLAKTLGRLYREAGQPNQSRAMLQQALTDARTLGIKELEGEALAERALLEAQTGSQRKAVEDLKEAVAILKAANSSSAMRWEQELKRREQNADKRQQSGAGKPRFRAN